MAQLAKVIEDLTRLDSAVSDALGNEVAQAAKEAIRDSAMQTVYSHQPQFVSRRMDRGGLIDEENLICTVEGSTLTVDNVTGLQNLWGGTHTELLTPVVEAGDPDYNMPGPRPFMERAEKELLSGKAQQALMQGLARQGIAGSGKFSVG